MAAINEAYRVLRDPGRRAIYDRELSGGPVTSAAPTSSSPPHGPVGDPRGWVARRARIDPNTPARMPWKMMGIAAAVGSAVVLVGAVFVEPPGEEPVDGILRPGSCVAYELNGDAREVACTGEGDLVVDTLIPLDARCPAGTEPHRDRLGLGKACVVGDAGS